MSDVNNWAEGHVFWYKGHRVTLTQRHYWGRKTSQWFWVTELEENPELYVADYRCTWFEAVDAINAAVENNPED